MLFVVGGVLEGDAKLSLEQKGQQVSPCARWTFSKKDFTHRWVEPFFVEEEEEKSILALAIIPLKRSEMKERAKWKPNLFIYLCAPQ